jgi:hypothetical protein
MTSKLWDGLSIMTSDSKKEKGLKESKAAALSRLSAQKAAAKCTKIKAQIQKVIDLVEKK